MQDTWTIDRVKEELPDVKVFYKGKVHTAMVNGRKNAFATVSIKIEKAVFIHWEFAWKTLAKSLNTSTALLV